MQDSIIQVENVSFTYDEGTEDALQAVKNISFSVEGGEHIAILGRNGSGKSSLARLLNALLLPQEGEVIVMGMNTQDEYKVWDIRSQLGMVFQNPDNQIVATTVEEDVAFGLENLGIPEAEMLVRVEQSLAHVGLLEMKQRQPSELSGGQKQKLALAGVLAMQPKCIILDEATAMLDPKSRKDLLRLLELIRAERNITVINVTHHMDEVLNADWVMVMSQGQLVLEGKPWEVFYQADTIKALGLDVPDHIDLAISLAKTFSRAINPKDIEDLDAAYLYISQLLRSLTEEDFTSLQLGDVQEGVNLPKTEVHEEVVIEVKGLSHFYNPNRIDTVHAVKDLSFTLHSGEFLGIAGHTGSGKSTLIQHLNALIKPPENTVYVLGMDAGVSKHVPAIRRKLGMVFQYPEQQLFAETILDDVSYGPKQMGIEDEEAKELSLHALEQVGLGDLEVDRSPFELSGGQMRRVAIAGILAMQPEILILDEPAAGLDPQGREEIFSTIKALQAQGVSIIFVSHSMDDLAKLADRIMVLKNGALQTIDTVENVFSNQDIVVNNDLDIPRVMQFAERFIVDYPSFDARVFTEKSLEIELLYQTREALIRGEGRNE